MTNTGSPGEGGGWLLDCLQGQVEEIEAVMAVFPEPGAVALSPVESSNLEYARQACQLLSSGGTNCSPADIPELSGMLSPPGCFLAGAPVSLRFQFPKSYPELPLKFQALTAAPRAQADAVQQVVQAVAGAHVGMPCLLLAAEALREAVEAIAAGPAAEEGQEPPGAAGPSSADGVRGADQVARCRQFELVRALIWFHHIKNLQKRRCIVQWAHELQMGGYSKPGFPGVVVVEGERQDVEKYIQRLKGLRWQAMSVRGEESEGASAAGAQTLHARNDGAPMSSSRRVFGSSKFAELGEQDMSRLAALCREAGLERLFLTALKLGT